MTVLDESFGKEKVQWRRGTLSDEEFDQAAAIFRPSWEQGLDVARRVGLAPLPTNDVATPVVPFTAASSEVQSLLAESAATRVVPPPPAAPDVPAVIVSEPAVEAKAEAPVPVPAPAPTVAAKVLPSATVTEPPPAPTTSRRPRVVSIADEAPTPPRNRTALYIGGGLLLVSFLGIGAILLGGSHHEVPSAPQETTSQPEAQSANLPAPAANPAPEAPEAPPAPTVVAAPEPVAPPPAPAPVVAAPEPVAPPPAPAPVVAPPAPRVVHPDLVATAPSVDLPHRVHVTHAASEPRATHSAHVHTAGFVSDNPY